jgi:hypothetical protein
MSGELSLLDWRNITDLGCFREGADDNIWI